MDRTRFAARIEASDLRRDIVSGLLARLKVASSEGCAAVVRDFDAAMMERRKQVLSSHRRFFAGQAPDPRNKMAVSLNVK